jgi:acetylserotonin N-methyltransferase
MSLPDPAPVLDLIEAFRRSKTMFAAVSIGVFDRLQSGPADLETLAAGLNAEAEPLQRLLDGCLGLGFLRRVGNCYANEPMAATYLCRDSDHSLAGYILYSNNVLFRLWSHLEDATRYGGHRWEQEFGSDGDIFDHFFRSDDSTRNFLKGMHGLGMLSSPKAVAAFDLSRFRRLVDLGGATGHLAIAACERYSNLHATVFDLPRVVEIARQQMRQHAPRLSSRIDFVGGDFFSDELPPADLYALGRIVHDWSEEKVRALLAKIYAGLPDGGGLLITETLLLEDRSGPVSTLMQSLNMLLCTEGKERTLSEYRVLLESVGFSDVQGVVTGAPLDAILAVKKTAGGPA